MTGPNGFDEAFSGLNAVEKIVPNEIFRGHEIEPGASIVVKKQAEFFLPNLHTGPQVITFFCIHCGSFRSEPRSEGLTPQGANGSVNPADAIHGQFFHIDHFQNAGDGFFFIFFGFHFIFGYFIFHIATSF
jgi:hypothetical protein